MGRVTSYIAVCVNSIQKHRLCMEASNNRGMDRLKNPLHKQNKSVLTTSLGKQRGSGRRGKLRKRRKREIEGLFLLSVSSL